MVHTCLVYIVLVGCIEYALPPSFSIGMQELLDLLLKKIPYCAHYIIHVIVANV